MQIPIACEAAAATGADCIQPLTSPRHLSVNCSRSRPEVMTTNWGHKALTLPPTPLLMPLQISGDYRDEDRWFSENPDRGCADVVPGLISERRGELDSRSRQPFVMEVLDGYPNDPI